MAIAFAATSYMFNGKHGDSELEDSYAQILEEAKRDRDAAVKKPLGLRKGMYGPVDMSQEEAERIEEVKIVQLTTIIDRLGFRDKR